MYVATGWTGWFLSGFLNATFDIIISATYVCTYKRVGGWEESMEDRRRRVNTNKRHDQPTCLPSRLEQLTTVASTIPRYK